MENASSVNTQLVLKSTGVSFPIKFVVLFEKASIFVLRVLRRGLGVGNNGEVSRITAVLR